MRKLKKIWKKIWWFIWEDDSIWSWIVNIILAFLIIKFLVYPGLGLALGTSHPVVAVVSGSMEHDGSFDDWWESPYCCLDVGCTERIPQKELYAGYEIEKERFLDFSFRHGFNKGDIMVLVRPKDINLGDIIVYSADHMKDPIIHRVVETGSSNGREYFATKGDHNCGSSDFEKRVTEERLVGKAVARIPFLGWIKIGFVGLLRLIGIGG